MRNGNSVTRFVRKKYLSLGRSSRCSSSNSGNKVIISSPCCSSFVITSSIDEHPSIRKLRRFRRPRATDGDIKFLKFPQFDTCNITIESWSEHRVTLSSFEMVSSSKLGKETFKYYKAIQNLKFIDISNELELISNNNREAHLFMKKRIWVSDEVVGSRPQILELRWQIQPANGVVSVTSKAMLLS
uniref:Uncharacterized protein n=1 Tax=Solanum lycopersicum TaxID=4081 RepID=A0A3Q7J945_SOLLC